LAAFVCPASGQPSATEAAPAKKAIFDLFSADEMTNLTITCDFDSIKANLRSKTYSVGSLEIKQGNKSTTLLNVKLRSRGKSRRVMCDFPPLKVKFSKESLKANGLETYDEFKLVTHCMEDYYSEVLIKKEFLVYKLYNLLTPLSYNAKLANITYKNTGSSFTKMKNIGILIEDPDCLSHRNQCSTLSQEVINLDSLNKHQEKITSVFQYMIGNADWSYAMARNMELIRQADGQIVPVPYDFDYSGLVKAPYSRANAALGQKTVLDRVYLGNAKSYQELKECLDYFISKKKELLAIIDDFKDLPMNERKEMKAYLNSFFDIIKDAARVENEMLKRI
jgi:lambda repressor-like predicted transcriptional regulator